MLRGGEIKTCDYTGVPRTKFRHMEKKARAPPPAKVKRKSVEQKDVDVGFVELKLAEGMAALAPACNYNDHYNRGELYKGAAVCGG